MSNDSQCSQKVFGNEKRHVAGIKVPMNRLAFFGGDMEILMGTAICLIALSQMIQTCLCAFRQSERKVLEHNLATLRFNNETLQRSLTRLECNERILVGELTNLRGKLRDSEQKEPRDG